MSFLECLSLLLVQAFFDTIVNFSVVLYKEF